MAEVVWTEPALADLDAIADYIALDKPVAAKQFVQRVLGSIERLQSFPQSGRRPPELGKQSRYREVIEPPCRVFYRYDGERVFILHVMRTERLFRAETLSGREPSGR